MYVTNRERIPITCYNCHVVPLSLVMLFQFLLCTLTSLSSPPCLVCILYPEFSFLIRSTDLKVHVLFNRELGSPVTEHSDEYYYTIELFTVIRSCISLKNKKEQKENSLYGVFFQWYEMCQFGLHSHLAVVRISLTLFSKSEEPI